MRHKHQAVLAQKGLSTKLLDRLFDTPVVTITDVSKTLGVSYPTASKLVEQFQDLGILKEITGKKRTRRFIYKEYIEILAEGTQPLR